MGKKSRLKRLRQDSPPIHARGQLLNRSPQDRNLLLVNDKGILDLFRSDRFWIRFGLAWLPALCAVGYRSLTNYSFGPVVGGALFSAGATVIFLQFIITGMVVSNLGVFLRESEPIRFWFSIFLVILVYCTLMIWILKR